MAATFCDKLWQWCQGERECPVTLKKNNSNWYSATIWAWVLQSLTSMSGADKVVTPDSDSIKRHADNLIPTAVL